MFTFDKNIIPYEGDHRYRIKRFPNIPGRLIFGNHKAGGPSSHFIIDTDICFYRTASKCNNDMVPMIRFEVHQAQDMIHNEIYNCFGQCFGGTNYSNSKSLITSKAKQSDYLDIFELLENHKWQPDD